MVGGFGMASMDTTTLTATPRCARREAFERALSTADRLVATGYFEAAYAQLERAHVLGQEHTLEHVRSHLGFLRWARAVGHRREIAGQLLRLVASALVTWLWVPRGNTGGARVPAMLPMPIEPGL